MDGEVSGELGYTPADKVDDALSWLDRQRDNPWFLWFAFNLAHTPMHMPPAEHWQSDHSDVDPGAMPAESWARGIRRHGRGHGYRNRPVAGGAQPRGPGQHLCHLHGRQRDLGPGHHTAVPSRPRQGHHLRGRCERTVDRDRTRRRAGRCLRIAGQFDGSLCDHHGNGRCRPGRSRPGTHLARLRQFP